MTVLNRYLLRRNLFLLFAILAVGAGVYVLSDLFQRIDVFLDSNRGAGIIGLYYLIKLPLIVSQILPAVFLLAMVVQLLLMAKNRETIALQSGGVSPAAMLRFVIIYGLVWSCLQFGFSQVLGVYGERVSDRLWQEDVRGRDLANTAVEGLLFTQGDYVVQAGRAWPQQERAEAVHIYRLTPDGNGILASYSAKRAESKADGWVLYDVELIEPPTYSHSLHAELKIDLKQDLLTFRSYEERAKTSEIDLPQLIESIDRLERAGTNVEGMRTELYGRFAYSGSILVMGLLAMALTMRTDSLYLGVVLSLVATFFFYTIGSFFSAMGQSGALPPFLGAWGANLLFSGLAALYIFSNYLRTATRKI